MRGKRADIRNDGVDVFISHLAVSLVGHYRKYRVAVFGDPRGNQSVKLTVCPVAHTSWSDVFGGEGARETKVLIEDFSTLS